MRRLSAETGWDMVSLLDDCRGNPAIRPYLREADGIRRAFRCSACKRAERPEDDTTFFLCDSCLRVMLNALSAPGDHPEMLLFRTYTPTARCQHASDNTLLAVSPWYGDDNEFGGGFCAQCVRRELERRGAR